MSLLTQAGQAVLNIFGGGKMNASQYQDCVGAVGIYGVGGTLAKYPQCQPFAAQLGAPMMAIPQAMPGGAALPPNYAYQQTPYAAPLQSQAISYAATPTPAMAMLPPLMNTLPKIMGPAMAGVAGAMSVIKSSLPILKKSVAIASGFTVVGTLVYTAAGQLVGRTRRRRRMNPLNYRAAKRAARRLCAVQDLCGQIEKAIPARAPRRARKPRYAFQKKRKC